MPTSPTFLNLKLHAYYDCVEKKTGAKLRGQVVDISREHVKIRFSDGSHVDLNMQSDVYRTNNEITFN